MCVKREPGNLAITNFPDLLRKMFKTDEEMLEIKSTETRLSMNMGWVGSQ